ALGSIRSRAISGICPNGTIMELAHKRSSDPMSVAEAKSLASEIHSSLVMVDILRTCRRALSTRFALGRLTLVQQRSTAFTATRYAPHEDGAPLSGPDIIPLEQSRLQQCMTEGCKIVAQIGNKAQQDNMERKYFTQQIPTTLAYVPLTCQGHSKGILVAG